MSKALLIIALLALAACEKPDNPQNVGIDQCMRRDLFQACLKALPAGPQSTQYNDWDEVVNSCESAALYQSRRRYAHIKPECKI